ncbi:MAG: DNA repair protein RecO [Bacteroidetes bacterium]|nr:DNA repair protein RecO [Bacteroidota bacterium]
MLHSTNGIVFHSLKYSETSIIVKVYTELFGLQSYLIKGIRSSRSKIKAGLFQPLTLLDLVVYHKEKQSLQSVKEVHLAHPFKNIPFDIRKSAVAMFINELIYKAIREEEANPDLFVFLWQTCLLLDETDDSVSGFHIHFAIRLCEYLGILPQNNYSDSHRIFNLREGVFQPVVPGHPHYLDPENSRLFSRLLELCSTEPMKNGVTGIWQNGEIFPNAGSRNQFLDTILLYYRLHLPGFKGVQSHLILHDVMA